MVIGSALLWIVAEIRGGAAVGPLRACSSCRAACCRVVCRTGRGLGGGTVRSKKNSTQRQNEDHRGPQRATEKESTALRAKRLQPVCRSWELPWPEHRFVVIPSVSLASAELTETTASHIGEMSENRIFPASRRQADSAALLCGPSWLSLFLCVKRRSVGAV